MIDHNLHTWLNVATALVIVGAAVYLTVIPYSTWGDD